MHLATAYRTSQEDENTILASLNNTPFYILKQYMTWLYRLTFKADTEACKIVDNAMNSLSNQGAIELISVYKAIRFHILL